MQHKTTIFIMIVSLTLFVATKVFALEEQPTAPTESNAEQTVYLPFTSADGQLPSSQAGAEVVSIDSAVTSVVEAAAVVPNMQVILLKNGMALLNLDTGSVSHCSAIYILEGSPLAPTPYGACVKIGSVGLSASGFLMSPVLENQVVIINKTNGDIFQCPTVVEISGVTPLSPRGICKKIGNTSSL